MKRALLIGDAIQVRAIKHLINAHSSKWRIISAVSGARNRALLQLPFVNAVVALGGPKPDALIAACARRLRKPIGMIWTGADVTRIDRGYDATARVRARRYRNAASAENIRKELRDLGISSDEVPIVACAAVENPAPLPETFTVLAYGGRNGEQRRGLNIILEAARHFPSIQFVVLGVAAAGRQRQSNVRFVHWDKRTERRIDASTVLLRLTRHDGVSRIVIEALARGRHVIWSQPLQGARVANDVDEVVRHLSELYAQHERKILDVNVDGIACVRDYFAPADVSSKLEAYLDDVARSAPAGRKRAVVSGSSQRVATFVEAAAAALPDWDFHAAISGSRAEAWDDALSLITAKRWYRLGDRREDRVFRVVARIAGKRRFRERTY